MEEYIIDKLEDYGLRGLAEMNLEQQDKIYDLEEENERLKSIIKEVRELLESKKHCERLLGGVEGKTFTEQALEILDKE